MNLENKKWIFDKRKFIISMMFFSVLTSLLFVGLMVTIVWSYSYLYYSYPDNYSWQIFENTIDYKIFIAMCHFGGFTLVSLIIYWCHLSFFKSYSSICNDPKLNNSLKIASIFVWIIPFVYGIYLFNSIKDEKVLWLKEIKINKLSRRIQTIEIKYQSKITTKQAKLAKLNDKKNKLSVNVSQI